MAAPISDHSPLPHLGILSAGPIHASETFVFLHGWGAGKELWWNALMALAETHRVIALDLPGTGGTPLQPETKTMADFSQWMQEVCRRLDLGSITLVGHSLGGNLAAQVALEAPELVRRLALVDAALEPAHLPARSHWPLSPRHGMNALRLLRWSSLPLAALGRHVPHVHAGGELRPAARRVALYVRANTDAALQRQLGALMGNRLDHKRLSSLRMPLLIVHGARDPMLPVSKARALAAALPHARLTIFPRAYHVPMDSDPTAFARTLREFCAEKS